MSGPQEMDTTFDIVVGDIPSSSAYSDLIVVPAKATIEECLKLFEEKNIQSAPVVDTADSKSVIGVINIVDLLTRVVFDSAFQRFGENLDKVSASDLQGILKENGNIMKSKIDLASGLSLESKITWIYKYDDDLSKVMNAFSSGVHRILVTLPEFKETEHAGAGKNLGFISQTDVVRFFMKGKAKELGKKTFDKTVDKVAHKGVKFVKVGAKAITTFRRMMSENELMAMPVVSAEGKLVDTVSVSDFRSIRASNITDLLLPIQEFLQKASARKGALRYHVTCSAKDKVSVAANAMLQSRAHRAWVVDDKGAPVGAVSYTDIIKAVYADL